MAETQTETGAKRKLTVQEQIAELKAKHPERVQEVPNGQTGETLAAKAEASKSVEPERVIEPKQFRVEYSRMSHIDCYTMVMTFQDVADYCEYAEELYTSVDGDIPDVTERWQRGVENKRVKDAGNYLFNETHFFPPLVCVPATTASTIRHDGHVTVNAHGLGVLDGQHRRGGILTAIERNPELATESIPVVILDLHDLEKRQQIFADVNRTPRKVSKALNLVFDHSDREAKLAMWIAKRPQGITSLVDFERLSPLRKSNNMLSLTNLYNLVKPIAQVRDDAHGFVLSDQQVADVVDAVLDNMPHIKNVRTGTMQFEVLKQNYVFPFSAIWQAIGTVVADMLTSRTAEGTLKYTAESIATAVGEAIKRITSSGSWDIASPRWSDPARPVVQNGKVGSRTEHIKAACSILRDFVNN